MVDFLPSPSSPTNRRMNEGSSATDSHSPPYRVSQDQVQNTTCPVQFSRGTLFRAPPPPPKGGWTGFRVPLAAAPKHNNMRGHQTPSPRPLTMPSPRPLPALADGRLRGRGSQFTRKKSGSTLFRRFPSKQIGGATWVRVPLAAALRVQRTSCPRERRAPPPPRRPGFLPSPLPHDCIAFSTVA